MEHKMKTFRQYLTESVNDLPSDLRSLVNKHTSMKNFTRVIYDATHRDLNELKMSDLDIRSGKKITTSQLEDVIYNNNMVLVVDLGSEGMLLVLKNYERGIYNGGRYFRDLYLPSTGRNVDVTSLRNIASVLNSEDYKDAKYWIIDLSKAKSTEEIRKARQEAQKGVIQRYNNSWYALDKSGYRVDHHKYDEMLQKLKIEGNDYVNQLSEISSRLFKAMANPKAKENSYYIGNAIDAIQTATKESVNSYSDATYVKDKIRKADEAVRKVESL